jgi:hypothetical protein
MKASLSLLLILSFFSSSLTFASEAEVDSSLYFNEVDGIIVAEIESLDPSSGWTEKTDRPGFSGSSFMEWTANNQFNNPGLGLMEYLVKINSPGTYRFQWHCRVGQGTSNTESNDSWLRIPDASLFYAVKGSNNDTVRPKGICTTDCPEGAGAKGWFKVYSSGTTNWTWSSRTSDNDPHLIYADFDTAGFYRVQISGRSKYHLLNRFVLHKSSVNDPTNLNRPETKVDYREKSTLKLSLKVIDGESKTAISRARVSVDQKFKSCDNQGSVFYYKLDPDTTHALRVTKVGYHDLVTDLDLAGDSLVVIELQKFATHDGEVLRNQLKVKISPNPVFEMLLVESEEGVEEILITDLSGRQVYHSTHRSERQVQINLGHLESGVYLARIYSSGRQRVFTSKFIKVDSF